ncbi:MAG: EspF repeat-containing protein [Limisphaerales bacterium]
MVSPAVGLPGRVCARGLSRRDIAVARLEQRETQGAKHRRLDPPAANWYGRANGGRKQQRPAADVARRIVQHIGHTSRTHRYNQRKAIRLCRWRKGFEDLVEQHCAGVFAGEQKWPRGVIRGWAGCACSQWGF